MQAHKMWVMENAASSTYRTIGKIRNQHIAQAAVSTVFVDDGIFRHPHVVGLRHAWLF
jgi:hypothetical protein